MSSPNESKSDKKGKLGKRPLLLIAAATTAVGVASIPIVKQLTSKDQPDWSKFAQGDSIPASIEPEEPAVPEEPTTSPEDLENALEESKAVDEQLADLGQSDESDSTPDENGESDANEDDNSNETPKKQSAYTVQSGDTLYDIAKRSGSTPQDIADSNGIDINTPIQVGQPLYLPGAIPTQPAGNPTTPSRPVTPVTPVIPTIANPTQPTGGRLPRPIIPTVVIPQTGSPLTPLTGIPPVIPIPTGFPIGPGPIPNIPSIPQNPQPGGPTTEPGTDNPLDKYGNAVAYQVQPFDSMSRIAKALSTTVEELVELNGRSNIRKGEMLIVPVDNCLVKDD